MDPVGSVKIYSKIFTIKLRHFLAQSFSGNPDFFMNAYVFSLDSR